MLSFDGGAGGCVHTHTHTHSLPVPHLFHMYAHRELWVYT